MSQVKHKNIVDFIGISCVVQKQEVWLISELMDYDLSKAIPSLTLFNKQKISKGIAKGMHYLHSFDPPVLHRDLKITNVKLIFFFYIFLFFFFTFFLQILLKKDGSCKISDFGVSRLLPTEMNSVTQEAGTLLYQAPESKEIFILFYYYYFFFFFTFFFFFKYVKF